MGSGAALAGGPIYVWASLGAVLALLLRQVPDRPARPLRGPCAAPARPLRDTPN
jgi:hypothetical protein